MVAPLILHALRARMNLAAKGKGNIMIARLCLAATVAAALAMPALADQQAARMAGEILAYGSACPTVEIDYQAVELWAVLHGVDTAQIRARSGDDFIAVSAGRSRAASRLSGMGVGEVCAEALKLYGPEGTAADDVLIPR